MWFVEKIDGSCGGRQVHSCNAGDSSSVRMRFNYFHPTPTEGLTLFYRSNQTRWEPRGLDFVFLTYPLFPSYFFSYPSPFTQTKHHLYVKSGKENQTQLNRGSRINEKNRVGSACKMEKKPRELSSKIIQEKKAHIKWQQPWRYVKKKKKMHKIWGSKLQHILSNAWPKTMVPDFHDIINLITYDWFLDLFASLSRTTVKPNAKQCPRLQVRKNPRMVWIEIYFFIEPVSRGWQLKRSQDWSQLLNRDCLLQSSFKNCLRFYFF